MDARTPSQNTQSIAQPEASAETVVAEQPVSRSHQLLSLKATFSQTDTMTKSGPKAMDPTQAPVSLRGGGEGEDICCGL